MSDIEIEEQLAEYSICITSKPSDQRIEELKYHFDVTDLGNGQIKIKYK